MACLGAQVTHEQGKRVLLCDFDTQSNASIWLLRLDRWNKINATGEGAVYSIFDPGRAQLRNLVIKDVVEGKAGEKLLPGRWDDVRPLTDQEFTATAIVAVDIEDAAAKRLRPIVMTKMVCILGLVPLYLFGGAVWTSLAVVMMGGLALGTLITLGLIPALYAVAYRVPAPVATGAMSEESMWMGTGEDWTMSPLALAM